SRSLPFLVVLATTTCGGKSEYVSPTVPQGPPPFIGPGGPVEPAVSGIPSASAPGPLPQPAGPPAPLTVFKTQSSSECIAKNFKVQPRYTRVLAASAGDKPPGKVSVGKLDLESPADGPAEELPVTKAFKS